MFSMCKAVEQCPTGGAAYPFAITMKSSNETFVEHTCYELALFLKEAMGRNRVHRTVHDLLYTDNPEKSSTMMVTGSRAQVAAHLAPPVRKSKRKTAKDSGQELDALESLVEQVLDANSVVSSCSSGADSDAAGGLLADLKTQVSDASEESDLETEDGKPSAKKRSSRKVLPPSRSSVHFGRDRNKILWKDIAIGHITEWQGNIGRHCRTHTDCRVPACRTYPTDELLISWLLSGIRADSSPAISRARHLDEAKALHEKHRAP